jgi:magnesium transporter
MAENEAEARDELVRGFLTRYPREAAGELERLPVTGILDLVNRIPPAAAANLVAGLHRHTAVEVLSAMTDERFVHVFGEIDLMEGTALLSRMDKEELSRRLDQLPARTASAFRQLISYPPESAGHLMDPRVLIFRREEPVQRVLDQVRRIEGRRITDVCITDEKGRLEGVVELQDIAAAKPDLRLAEIMDPEPLKIHAMSPHDDVVAFMDKGRLASLPVVDWEGRLLGIIRYSTLVDTAQYTISDDMQTMFGAGRDERALSRASFAVRKRLPWLEINLVTAFLAAFVVGLFEDTISRITALAVFLPVVAGQSGNTGSQALAVSARGLALREIQARHWPKIIRKECTVGLINGLAVALTTALVAYIWMSSVGLSVIIGSSMVISMVVAGACGALIPIILQTLGQDPAQSSSIFLTTVTDVVGFLSFLGLAALLAGYFGLG